MTAVAIKESPFRDVNYKKNRNLEEHYRKQIALLLSKFYKKDINVISKLTEKVFKRNTNGFKDIKFKITQKNKHGDRQLKVVDAGDYFETAEANNYHVSPSLVCYTNSDEEQCVNSIGTVKFLGDRKFFKGKRQEAKAVGNLDEERAANQMQNALKIFNNAQSGAMSSNGTPINNKSGHTSLTSTCRVLTSIANITNEKLLTGNRLFISYERTIENFLSLIVSTDLKRMSDFMQKNDMVHATAEQVMDMVRRCTYYYWKDTKRLNMIKEFLDTLKPVELSAILLICDINGLALTNPAIIKKFFDDWNKVPELVDGKEGIEPTNTDYFNLCVSKLRYDPNVKKEDFESKEAADKQFKANKAHETLMINQLNEYHLHLEEKWFDFIEIFFKTMLPPSGVYSIKEMVRESVLTSDTDSSIYTVDEVLEKHCEDDENERLNMNASLTYFIRMISVHQHALFSKNMNVAQNNLHRLNMKNEYMFGSYVTTLMSKHYFATQVMVEGVMNSVIAMEIKGVHLRSSRVAKEIKDFAHKLMRDILDAIYENRQLDAATILKEVADLERAIYNDIMVERSPVWLTTATIKSREIYSKPESSVYFYHELWENAFAGKYGEAPVLPYRAYKLNTTTGNRTKIETYLESLGASGVADGLRSGLGERKELNTIYIPVELVERTGQMPKEAVQVADIRGIIKQNLKSIYAVLETTGLYYLNENITRLVSDEH